MYEQANAEGPSSSAPQSTSQTSHSVQAVPHLGRRRPVPRKGHKKSRLGCNSCKRRKVKCDETQPKCAGCRRLGIICGYDQAKHYGASAEEELTSIALVPSLRPTSPSLNMDDLRFFSHFLFYAYPFSPIGGKAVWHRMSQISHEVGYRALTSPRKSTH